MNGWEVMKHWPHGLDSLDLKLVGALRRDGRLSNAELAERTLSSASQCSRHKQRLEELGVIRGYRAQLDAIKLGYNVIAYTLVSLSPHSTLARTQFTRIVAGTDAIQSCHSVTGAYDYILRIAARDLGELKDLLHTILEQMGPGTRIQSMVVLDNVKDEVSIV
jgi:Lrp/AsnC family leucine-responsive transcriptional regulator